MVGLFAQLGWTTLNFSALPVWVKFKLHQGHLLGIFVCSFMLTEAVLRPYLGALSDRIGRKPLIMVGPLMSIFTSVATVYTTSPYIMVLLRGLDGVGLAAFWPAAFAAIGEAVEEKSRGTAMAILNGTMMAGISLAFPLGGLANSISHSFDGSFYLVSAIFAFTAVVGLVIFPRTMHKHHLDHKDAYHIPDAEEVRSVIRIVPDMLTISIVVFAAMGVLMPVIKLYAMEQLAMKETEFGAMLGPIAAVLGILAVPFGRIADKLGKMVSFCYGMVICTLAMWLIAVFRSIIIMIGAGTMLGVGFALAFPAWMAVVAQAAPPARRGQVMGAVGMTQGIGAMIGTVVGPVVYSTDWLSLPRMGVMNRNLPFYLCAMLLSIATVMAFTWIAGLRSIESNGRKITWKERRSIVAAGMVGLMIICGWIVYRYTRPLPAERVAWLWVQAAVHGDADRAKRYTLPSFEKPNKDGLTPSDIAAKYYYDWSKKKKAYYTPPSNLKINKERNEAEVRVIFHFEDRTKLTEIIVLRKQRSGNWLVAERRSAR